MKKIPPIADIEDRSWMSLREEIVNDYETVDDLIKVMSVTKTGEKISGFDDGFKSRYDTFKLVREKSLPMFTDKEFLKAVRYLGAINEMIGWYSSEYYFMLMEYELRKDYVNDSEKQESK